MILYYDILCYIILYHSILYHVNALRSHKRDGRRSQESGSQEPLLGVDRRTIRLPPHRCIRWNKNNRRVPTPLRSTSPFCGMGLSSASHAFVSRHWGISPNCILLDQITHHLKLRFKTQIACLAFPTHSVEKEDCKSPSSWARRSEQQQPFLSTIPPFPIFTSFFPSPFRKTIYIYIHTYTYAYTYIYIYSYIHIHVYYIYIQLYYQLYYF